MFGIQEKSFLFQTQGFIAHRSRQQRKARQRCPGVHEGPNWFAGYFLQGSPQIDGVCVTVLMGLQVMAQAVAEGFRAEIFMKHMDDTGALTVTNGIEDCSDFVGVVDGHLDGVRMFEGIKL